MRISNWTQFAKIFGDPNEPGQRPVHGGRVPRPLRLRLLPERRLPLLDRAGRRATDGAARGRARRCPPAADNGVEAFRAEALAGRRRPSRSSSPRSPAAERKDGEPTYKLVVTAGASRRGVRGPDAQEGPQQPRHQGQRRVEADQDRGDRRRRCPRRSGPATGTYTLSAPSDRPDEGQADRLRGRRRPPHGHGRPRRRRRGHDGRDAGHHDARRRRRRRPGPRPPGQDDRPLRERRRPHGDPRRAAGPAPAGRSSSGG